MKRFLSILTIIGITTLLNSCGAIKPSTFIQATDGGTWSTIQIRDDLTYEKAWNEVLDVIARRFEMDMISKDGGYARSQWNYTWNLKGKYMTTYRVRVVYKFSADRTRVEIKTEAEFGGEPRWIKGYDTRLLSTIKQDVMGVVSRTTL